MSQYINHGVKSILKGCLRVAGQTNTHLALRTGHRFVLYGKYHAHCRYKSPLLAIISVFGDLAVAIQNALTLFILISFSFVRLNMHPLANPSITFLPTLFIVSKLISVMNIAGLLIT